MSRKRALAVAIAMIFGWVLAAAAPNASGQIEPRIVNGVFESEQASTGALLWGTNPDTAWATCSGTMIGCETFLTAAHCVCDTNGAGCTGAGAPDPSDFSVFLQHAGFFNVSSISLRSDYDFPVADVAVLKLSTPISGIRPSPINTTQTPPAGTPGIIVGFGRSGGLKDDYGLKRSGAVTTASCTGGISNTTSVCWTFEHPIGPLGEDSNTCNGDSGGPLFVDFGAGPVVAGVTSGGESANCLPTDLSYDANVYHYRTWIESEGGADLQNESCGDLAQVGDPEALIFGEDGELSGGTPEASHSFTIPDHTVLLRVTMNAEDDGWTDFDLYVKSGSVPTKSDFDCARTGPGQLAFCEFSEPSGGDWYVLVTDESETSGAYQVTATAFTASCADPGSEGEPCDDRNVCTIGDTCQSGECVGSALPDGSDCDDGSLCTRGDACQSGVCVPGPAPITECRGPLLPGKSRLLLVDKPKDRFDRIVWRWAKGEETLYSDFGDPMTNTHFALCVYDEVDDNPILISETVIPPGPWWMPLAIGYRYRDGRRANDGVRVVRLKEGPELKARIVVRAVGDNVQLPALPPQQDSRVVVQLVNDDACWEATYTTWVTRDAGRFDARSD